MPQVKSRDALVKAYLATKKRLDTTDIPTMLLRQDQTFFRSFDPTSRYSTLGKPQAGKTIPVGLARGLLAPSDGTREGHNRFSGPAEGIPSSGGFYCAIQQQALVNESAHYNRRVATWALTGKCVLKIRLTQLITVAELSPHNDRSRRFLRSLGAGTWEEMTDRQDCSVARGIGLAVAQCSYLSGLIYQTVRTSERSDEELGDNIVFFAPQGRIFEFLTVEEVSFFGKSYAPEVFQVEH
jgi:hypothetical protein